MVLRLPGRSRAQVPRGRTLGKVRIPLLVPSITIGLSLSKFAKPDSRPSLRCLFVLSRSSPDGTMIGMSGPSQHAVAPRDKQGQCLCVRTLFGRLPVLRHGAQSDCGGNLACLTARLHSPCAGKGSRAAASFHSPPHPELFCGDSNGNRTFKGRLAESG